MNTVSEELCQERHRRIDEALERLEKGLGAMAVKVDDALSAIVDIRLFVKVPTPSQPLPVVRPTDSRILMGGRDARPLLIGAGSGGGMVLLLELAKAIIEAVKG